MLDYGEYLDKFSGFDDVDEIRRKIREVVAIQRVYYANGCSKSYFDILKDIGYDSDSSDV